MADLLAAAATARRRVLGLSGDAQALLRELGIDPAEVEVAFEGLPGLSDPFAAFGIGVIIGALAARAE
jgi:hypothetical protein